MIILKAKTGMKMTLPGKQKWNASEAAEYAAMKGSEYDVIDPETGKSVGLLFEMVSRMRH